MVEHPAVNRRVASSSLARGARRKARNRGAFLVPECRLRVRRAGQTASSRGLAHPATETGTMRMVARPVAAQRAERRPPASWKWRAHRRTSRRRATNDLRNAAARVSLAPGDRSRRTRGFDVGRPPDADGAQGCRARSGTVASSQRARRAARAPREAATSVARARRVALRDCDHRFRRLKRSPSRPAGRRYGEDARCRRSTREQIASLRRYSDRDGSRPGMRLPTVPTASLARRLRGMPCRRAGPRDSIEASCDRVRDAQVELGRNLHPSASHPAQSAERLDFVKQTT